MRRALPIRIAHSMIARRVLRLAGAFFAGCPACGRAGASGASAFGEDVDASTPWSISVMEPTSRAPILARGGITGGRGGAIAPPPHHPLLGGPGAPPPPPPAPNRGATPP